MKCVFTLLLLGSCTTRTNYQINFTLLLQDCGFSTTSNLGSSNVKLGNVFMSGLPYICLSLKSSRSRSCWYSGSASTGPPDVWRLVLYSLILSTKSFCTGSSSLLNATAVTPMFLLRETEIADWTREDNLKSLWRIMVILVLRAEPPAAAASAAPFYFRPWLRPHPPTRHRNALWAAISDGRHSPDLVCIFLMTDLLSICCKPLTN